MQQNKGFQKVKFADNKVLGDQLRRGDRPEIAKLTGFSLSHVRNVLNGTRDNPEIISWAKRIINDRNLRLNQIENPNTPGVG